MRTTGRTTIKADTVLPIAAERARDELSRIFTATERHHPVLLSVGPGRSSHGIAKQVAAILTPPQHHGSTYVFDLHWWPVGFGARAYPILDAKVGVTAVDELTSLLSIVADYVPPLGTLGATADRAAMSRVAEATVTALIHRIADDITQATRPAVGV